ncbi:MAG: adenylosuccinate lyase [Deltaproteobacteria bacterium]|nr:MAG: adenylosuccinate lyase [Deltaproteobacteria bacterium]
MEKLNALTSLDGRYRRLTEDLRHSFSEFGLIRNRHRVEMAWLEFILADLKLAAVTESELDAIAALKAPLTEAGAARIKEIERKTNHDVKALEYYIKSQMDAAGLGHLSEWVHFACTSDDINNTAYALMVGEGKALLLAELNRVLAQLETLARDFRSIPMMSRTHGQPATPTTLGKELVNFAWRLDRERKTLAALPIMAKMNGATGNYNAHAVTFPDIDWIDAGERFLTTALGVEPILFSTQINPNHYLSEILHALIRMAATCIDLDRDFWGYISLGYFRQKTETCEVGSSTMPHKVNPIDFENSEGNMGMAISMMDHLAVKLLNSRFQRDLTDSTVLRNLGAVFGYLVIGLKNTLKGLKKVEIDGRVLAADLEQNPELLAEPIQTMMRVYGEPQPYEKLKALTRGKRISLAEMGTFIDSLTAVPDPVKARMKQLTPATYIGMAEALVDRYFSDKPTS